MRRWFSIFLVGVATMAKADDNPLSFAFASQAGSGIYNIEGRVVQIYRIPIEFDVRALQDERRWGASVTLPLTFGFYDYETTDLLEGEFPSHVGTASLLPGVEFRLRLKDNWTLYPHVDVGAAKDFSGNNLVWVYDTGMKSVVAFPAGSWEARAGQELLWAGAAETGDALTDWYGEAMAGFEFRHDLPWSSGGSVWDIGGFVTYSRYVQQDSPESPEVAVGYSAPAATPGVDEQTEIGFSFGTRPKLAWKKISMPKLGFSCKFGDGVQGVRLVIGEIF